MHTVFALLCFVVVIHWLIFSISVRLTSLALWQSNDCPNASKATLMNMDKYFMWIHYERLHNHNKAKHNKTVCMFLGIYCTSTSTLASAWCFIWEKKVSQHQLVCEFDLMKRYIFFICSIIHKIIPIFSCLFFSHISYYDLESDSIQWPALSGHGLSCTGCWP